MTLYVHRQRAYDAVRTHLVAAHDCVVPPSPVDATPPPPTADDTGDAGTGAPVYLCAETRRLLTELLVS